MLPVLILIATASRLSAARREERFAAMRLVGATPRQISVVSAVEAVVAALAGVAVGFALFFVFRPLLYHVPFTGAPFAQGDLSLHGIDIVLAVIGVPIAAVVSARLALRRVQISPLGVNRRASSRPPRIVRIIPLLAGIAVLAYFDAHGKPGSNGGQLLELLVGFVLLVVGLVLAGPWFTTAGSRLMVKRASRPATLIAGRRLLDNPKAAFRFISGLVIALFVASASDRGAQLHRRRQQLWRRKRGERHPRRPVLQLLDVELSRFRASSFGPRPGACRAPHDAGSARRDGGPPESRPQAQLGNSFGVVACDQLAKTPAIGKCAPGATVASIGYFLSNLLGHNSHASSTVWPSAHLSAADAARLPVDAVVVATDGSSSAIERVRTTLERAFPFQGAPVAVEALDPSTARLLTMIQDMTDVIIVASLIIAACSLAVNIVAGLGERKRPFSLLRLTGVPTALLHRVVALESALPLLLVAAVSIVVGLVSAALYLHSQVGIAFSIPGIGVLGDRRRRTGGFARDHRLDVPAPQSDDGTRGRPKRLIAPHRTARRCRHREHLGHSRRGHIPISRRRAIPPRAAHLPSHLRTVRSALRWHGR